MEKKELTSWEKDRVFYLEKKLMRYVKNDSIHTVRSMCNLLKEREVNQEMRALRLLSTQDSVGGERNDKTNPDGKCRVDHHSLAI